MEKIVGKTTYRSKYKRTFDTEKECIEHEAMVEKQIEKYGTFTCGLNPANSNDDYWSVWDGVPCCSFCGSSKVSYVIDAFDKNEAMAQGTTKGYKRYIKFNDKRGTKKLYAWHISEEEHVQYNEKVKV